MLMMQRDETRWRDCHLPETHVQNQNLVIKLKESGDMSRTQLQASLPLCRNPLLGDLALLQYCNIISYKMNASSVNTVDIYALITDNQIQIGQFINSYPSNLPDVVNDSFKYLLL